MGCFNHMGFHSKLPIVYGDEIVLIIGYYFNNMTKSNATVYPTDKFTPLFLPIKGKYNDYGGIEDYDKDITDTIEKIIEVDFDKFIDCIDSNCANMSLKDLEKAKNTDNRYVKKDIEIYEKALSNIVNEIRNNNELYAKYYDLESLSVSYTMERYDVYHKISSLFNWYLKDTDIDKLFEFRNDFKSKGFILNEYKMTMDAFHDIDEIEKIDDNNEKLEFIKKWNNDKNKILESSKIALKLKNGNSSDLCKGYEGTRLNELYLKDKIKEFLCFNFGLYHMCGVYCQSPTAHQDITDLIDEVKILNEFYKDILFNI